MTSTGPGGSETSDRQRLDKWLWFARVVKTRTLASGLVADGKVRINKERITKPSAEVKPGDVVTVSLGGHIRIIKVIGFAVRRGAAPEAARLYEELTVPATANKARAEVQSSAGGKREFPAASGVRAPGSGRPTKRDRRKIANLLGRDEDC